jgi:hypothetical protein
MTRSACVLTCSRRPGTSAERRFRAPASVRYLFNSNSIPRGAHAASFQIHPLLHVCFEIAHAFHSTTHPPEQWGARRRSPVPTSPTVSSSASPLPPTRYQPLPPGRRTGITSLCLAALDRSCTRCPAALLGIVVLISEILIVFHCLGCVVTAAVSSSVIASGVSLLHFLISVTNRQSGSVVCYLGRQV